MGTTHTMRRGGLLSHRGQDSAAPAPRTEIRISGLLVTDAEFRLSVGARQVGLLTLVIDQPDGDTHIRCCQNVGSGTTAIQAAKAKALQLQRGTRVTVYGSQLIQHTNRDLIELVGVRDITYAPPPPRQLRD
jgi:hypothetical protein